MPDTVAYAYSADPALSYMQRLATVNEVDPGDGRLSDPEVKGVEDEEILTDLGLFIRHGHDMGKMELVQSTARKLGVPKRRVLSLLEAQTGDDPARFRWHQRVGAHGKHTFSLHEVALAA